MDVVVVVYKKYEIMKKYEKTYVSGKITGLTPEQCKENFRIGTEECSEFSDYVLNIYEEVPYDPNKTWSEYMVDDLRLLLLCDSIYLLDNWGDSKGARIERMIALELGIAIIYQSEYRNK